MRIRRTTVALLPFAVAAAVGIAVGVGGYTFVYAHGASYLTNDPAACANCHIMRPYYDAWRKSSHRAVAVCNDCHTPAGLVGKYLTKTSNGWHHSVAFTSGDFHEPLRARPSNAAIAEANCRRCHSDIASSVDGHGATVSCVRCHDSVGHMR